MLLLNDLSVEDYANEVIVCVALLVKLDQVLKDLAQELYQLFLHEFEHVFELFVLCVDNRL